MNKYIRLAASVMLASQILAGVGEAQDVAARRSADALRYFDAICGSTLPDFRNAPAALQANKFQQVSSGTWILADGSVSIQIKEGPGLGNTCSFVANSSDSSRQIKTAVVEMFPKMASSNIPNSTLYKNSTALVSFDPRVMHRGRLSIFHLEMLSAR